MNSFLAMITVMDGSGNRPDNTLPGPQPPTGQPPGYWGGIAPPWVDNTLPGQPPRPTHPIAPGGRPPYPSQGPGFPTNPIAPGGPPPGYWGGVAPPWVDNTLPGGGGGKPPGIWGGGNVPMPTPPIYLPPGTLPDVKPEHPIYIPPSSGVPGVPTHPIVLPPGEPPEVLDKWEVKTAWSEQTGWIVAIVPTDEVTVPTPSS